ncbi:alcohol dehydrogenase catalytic domain-containing protein [Arthrobacter sp. ISL-28]|uniref:alcohol dehydrogenase catalytic domain-containing protein n=1 Tax=Arthrobacter sp. ISL-28 TaxID=2819108 RepID=UPI0037C06FC2
MESTVGLPARRGLKGTSIQAIADATGHSKAGILNRFAERRPVRQVRIQVHAVGVNPADTLIRSGAAALPTSTPLRSGSRCRGHHRRSGSRKRWRIGDEVTTFQLGRILPLEGSGNSHGTGPEKQSNYSPSAADRQQGTHRHRRSSRHGHSWLRQHLRAQPRP